MMDHLVVTEKTIRTERDEEMRTLGDAQFAFRTLRSLGAAAAAAYLPARRAARIDPIAALRSPR
jgi:hypothetical protein